MDYDMNDSDTENNRKFKKLYLHINFEDNIILCNL